MHKQPKRMEIILTLEQAAKLTGKSTDDLQALLDGVEQTEHPNVLTTAIATHAKALRDKATEAQYNRGIKEKGQAIERALKPIFEKHGIEGFTTAEEGITQLAEQLEKVETGTPDFSTLTPDVLNNLPQVAKLRNALQAATLKAEEAESNFNNYKAQQSQAAARQAALAATVALFESENAATGAATKSAAAEMFLRTIPTGKIGVDASGSPVILGDDGQPETDEFGKAVNFADYVRTNYAFGFNAADPSKGGSGAGAGGNSNPPGGVKYKTAEEAEAAIAASMSAGDNAALAEARKALIEIGLTRQ